jgi:hypothetical protein
MREDRELKVNDIQTTVRIFKDYHQLKITLRGYYFIIRIYKSSETMNTFIAQHSNVKAGNFAGAYIGNVPRLPKNKMIGTIALTFISLTNPLIIHECIHAALGYHSWVFNKNYELKPNPISIRTLKEEEFFCTLVGCLYNEIMNYATGSYRVLMHVAKKQQHC